METDGHFMVHYRTLAIFKQEQWSDYVYSMETTTDSYGDSWGLNQPQMVNSMVYDRCIYNYL